jgi:uncharacterized coiled-coil protein SlyX
MKTIESRWFIAVIAGAILMLFIVGNIFVHRLGILKEREKALENQVAQSKAKITALNDSIAATKSINEQLAAKVAQLEPEIDSILTIVENREITILKTKKYGQQAINDYLSLPIDEREAAFTKLIGRK